MASKSYYNKTHSSHADDQQYLLEPSNSYSGLHAAAAQSISPNHSTPLKQLHLVTNMDKISGRSGSKVMAGQHHQSFDDFEALKAAKKEDAHLKLQIRRLRALSRILALLISIAVLVPMSLTLHKYLTTRDVYRVVPNPSSSSPTSTSTTNSPSPPTITRTAWANNTTLWPTTMYFSVAATSTLLNALILLSYTCGGVATANRFSTLFTWVLLLSHLAVWSVAATVYRTEKRTKDLWGWSCSPEAEKIQGDFADVLNFGRVCGTQSVAWYVGIVQVVAAGLTVGIYVLVGIRRRVKKRVGERERGLGL